MKILITKETIDCWLEIKLNQERKPGKPNNWTTTQINLWQIKDSSKKNFFFLFTLDVKQKKATRLKKTIYILKTFNQIWLKSRLEISTQKRKLQKYQ